MPLVRVVRPRPRPPEIDFLKVDIEGSEHDVFAAASPETCSAGSSASRLEYHDQIVPGTLELLRSVLSSTHELTILARCQRKDVALFALHERE